MNLLSLDIQKSSGPDGISPLGLRAGAPELTPVLIPTCIVVPAAKNLGTPDLEDHRLINDRQYHRFHYGRPTGNLLVYLAHRPLAVSLASCKSSILRASPEFMQVDC